jgi:hypothetical protein
VSFGASDNLKLYQLLLELAAIADEACVGVGLPRLGELDEAEQQFYDRCDELLDPSVESGSSLCIEIDPVTVRVLPKMHTPQTGLTVRSLSHNLAICTATEMVPEWRLIPNYLHDENCLNILVIPWPRRIQPVQFCSSQPLQAEMKNMSKGEFGFFTFDVGSGERLSTKQVESLITEAERMMGQVHGIILPELALSQSDFDRLSKYVVDKRSLFLIAGVGTPAKASKPPSHPMNEVLFSIPLFGDYRQSKHHRWRLDQQQLSQYGLGSRLDPGKLWWEHICLDDRKIAFVALLPWLAVTCLICEDLARPEPVGDLVRAVGPNLVIAILMDGPQLSGRWPGRYAMSLADDPGSSVLSVTSLGMSELSRPQDLPPGPKRNRVVALWKDAKSSTPVEIELPQDADAIVLSISERYFEEWTADGRSDRKATGYPALTGMHPVRVSSKR